jgi:hypothetical protein
VTALAQQADEPRRGAVVVDDDGDAYVTGYIRTGVRRLQTLVVAKYAVDGTRRWLRTWRNPGTQTVGNAIALGRDGRIFVGGSVSSDDEGGPAGWFVRAYGPSGDSRWHRDQDGWRGQVRRSAVLGIDAGNDLVVVAITTEGPSGYHDGGVRAFRSDGSRRWIDPFEVPGFSTHDRAVDVAVGDGGAFVVGQLDQKPVTDDRPSVDQEVVIQRLDAGTGDRDWIDVMKDAEARDADTGTTVDVRRGVVAIGARLNGGSVTAPRPERGHAWVGRIRPSTGAIMWKRAWGQANRNAAEPAAVAVGPTGRVHVVGTTRGRDNGVDAFLRSFEPGGAHAGGLRLGAGRFLHGTGVATAVTGSRVWLAAWHGTHAEDRPDGGHLWQLRP